MNPNPPKTSTPETPLGLTPKKPDERFDSFFGITGVKRALDAHDFDQEQFIGILIQNMKGMDPNVALRAASQYWSYFKDLALLNGMVGTATITRESENADGTRITESASQRRLLSGLSGQSFKGDLSGGGRFIPAAKGGEEEATSPTQGEGKAPPPD